MGCICSKGTSANEYVGNNARDRESKRSSKRYIASSRREEVVVEVDNGGSDATTRLISTEPTVENLASIPTAWDEGERKDIVVEKQAKSQIQKHAATDGGKSGQSQISQAFNISNGVDGAQVAAGWPSWLTAVAGEAIKGWVPRKADSFEKLDKIGQGTYSSVYRARDLETGKIVALKKVRFVNMDPDSVRFMAREILILRRLDHPNVMKLEGLVTSRMSGNLYLVFEYMEHDLAGLVVSPLVKFSEPQIKCYMQQLLRGLEHCHSRGVLHRDIKGSNLLIDNKGNLKIGDFGLATFFRSNAKQPLTSRVVTLWYRPPELLLGATDYGASVDLWSAGCILAELYAGKPIMPGRTEVEQLHKIFKLCGSPSDVYWQKSKLPHATIFKPQHPYKRCVAETFKDFPSSVLALLDVLLAVEPESRGSASSALQSEFFTTKPLPCEPSSLPKYPPSKEFNAKLRDDEARRQREAAGKGHVRESYKKGSRESKAVPAPDANAELHESIQKRLGQSNAKSNSEKFNREEDGGSGFRMEPSRGMQQDGLSHSGQLVQHVDSGSSTNKSEDLMGSQPFASKNGSVLRTQNSFRLQGLTQFSRFSNSVAVRGSSRFDMSGGANANPHWPEERLNAQYGQLDDAESSVNQEWSQHLLDVPKSHSKDKQAPGNESTMAHAPKKNRIHYSGPLLPPGGNIEEVLKEHEKQIQHAVRKARVDKTRAKTKKMYGDNGQTESLLHHGVNGR
ncbi:probable serine/threonine-protein kinase At1g09600 [Diospyros lotus]|uniref:probable serine/threonine-protein kinase At1g09600 n=1 Tax=Diospyros lotus TaxID=55363 RepID=UPI002255CA19|nr:probable serine/threonine-protein kinase At1g09600 [Diospyros lotus]XP_052206273.1 probable serine/threonine-protein kinase At1g09600 [Diospyros lotus]XP_052206274.1 probable serine/threonine-protein kinase At1g09600 [Diospyros lotus]